jgi:tetratricopeptide (TPR) repeat protein
VKIDNSKTKLKDRYNVEDRDSLPESDKPETNLTSLAEKSNQIASGKFNKDMYDYLIFNIYIYRSYGYVAIEKYESALQDLAKAKAISPESMDRASIYNKWLSRGILKMDTEEYLMASKYFGKASLRFPDNKDSFCLNVISIVRSYNYSMANQFIDDL